jgi:tripartite-type tricarboxylate transporter receptor subunit TctC
MRRTCFALIAVVVLALVLAPAPASAQDYPARPIRLIVPYAAGTSTDLIGRQLAERLAEALSQRLIVENKAGAGGSLGTAAAARSEPDGYTLVLGTGQTHAVNVSLYKNLGYDPVADFAPVARVGNQPLVMAVHPLSVAARRVEELVALAKAKPGASVTARPAAEPLRISPARRSSHWRGSISFTSPITTSRSSDLLSGRVSLIFYPYPPLKGYIDANKLLALATTGAARSPWLPTLPTMAEAGYPTFVFAPWFALTPRRARPPRSSRSCRGQSSAC